MKLTKKEILFVQGYFNVINKYINAPPTKENLIRYGYYCGRIYAILVRRIDCDKLEEAHNYIKETFGDKIWQWYIKENENFVEKDKEILIEK